MKSHPLLATIAVPVVVWILGSLAKKVARGDGFRLGDGCLGAESSLVAIVWGVLQTLWIAESAQAPDRRPALLAMLAFLVLAAVVHVTAISAQRSWAREIEHARLDDRAVYRTAPFWLCGVALNLAGSSLLGTLVALRGYAP